MIQCIEVIQNNISNMYFCNLCPRVRSTIFCQKITVLHLFECCFLSNEIDVLCFILS